MAAMKTLGRMPQLAIREPRTVPDLLSRLQPLRVSFQPRLHRVILKQPPRPLHDCSIDVGHEPPSAHQCLVAVRYVQFPYESERLLLTQADDGAQSMIGHGPAKLLARDVLNHGEDRREAPSRGHSVKVPGGGRAVDGALKRLGTEVGAEVAGYTVHPACWHDNRAGLVAK